MIVTPSAVGTTGLVGTLTVQIWDPITDQSLLDETVLGIHEIGTTGVYYYRGDIDPVTRYIVIWDDQAGNVGAEEIELPSRGTTLVPQPVGDPQDFHFAIRRGDSLPVVQIQTVNLDGTIEDLTGAQIIFNVRRAVDSSETLVVHQSATLVDPENGIVQYQWTPGDTEAMLGDYLAEFEVNLPTGDVKTYPEMAYIQIHVIGDLDPGLNP